MVTNIDNHIRSLNFGYRKQLREQKVKYINAFASFVDANTIQCTYYKKDGVTVDRVETITTKTVIIAVGGRPKIPDDIPGAKEYCITSDDLFWRKAPPGRTLVVGASYVALECAGFIKGCGFDTTVMVRSILLRGFDQQMADKIGSYMESHGIR
jgi:pyruvate/2-oxoglutarate dehydrogenase complex dihydrolipoamide dehydrogenase (E3) component